MEGTYLIERGLGIFYLVMGISFLLNAKKLWQPLVEKLKDPAYTIFLGVFTSSIGTFLVLSHNIWEKNPAVLLSTVSSWGIFLEGISYLLLPGFFLSFMPKSLGTIRWVGGFISIVTGAVILLN
jgi:hypothetical protein